MCGLGQTAANPVLSTLRYFRDEYRQHIKQKKCPALVCKEIVSSPCQYVCPIDQEASTYIALIAQGNYEEAFRIIMKDNPLPSVCARVCHHPCETVLPGRRIRRADLHPGPQALRHGLGGQERHHATSREPVEQNREKIAIIGAGPAGLTAGYFLARKGFRPTIFEALPVAGGMLAVGIPDHRLPQAGRPARRSSGSRPPASRSGPAWSWAGTSPSTGCSSHGYKAVFCATGAGQVPDRWAFPAKTPKAFSIPWST